MHARIWYIRLITRINSKWGFQQVQQFRLRRESLNPLVPETILLQLGNQQQTSLNVQVPLNRVCQSVSRANGRRHLLHRGPLFQLSLTAWFPGIDRIQRMSVACPWFGSSPSREQNAVSPIVHGSDGSGLRCRHAGWTVTLRRPVEVCSKHQISSIQIL